MKEKVGIIINPKSGVERNKMIADLAMEVFEESHYEVTIAYTQAKHDGAVIAKRMAKQGIRTIIVVGGDGSVNDVIQGILHEDVSIGIIPKGSGNGLSRSLHIPFDERKALMVIKEGYTKHIDIGMANGRAFVSNVGVGFDCTVAEAFAKSESRGLATYALLSMKTFWKYKTRAWIVNSDKESKQGKYLLLNVCNIEQFGNNFYTAPRAIPDDGKLHILRLKDFPKLLSIPLVAYAFTKNIHHFTYTRLRSAQCVSIAAADDSPFYYQADGDVVEKVMKLEVTILPKKLSFFIPKNK